MSRPARLLSVVFLIGTVIAMPIAAFGVVFSIDPASAYLRTSQDSGVSNALALDLAALGIAPGHVIQILQLGAFKSGEPFADETTFTLGVFSSSAALLAPSALHRVPGAIASMEPDWWTGSTFFDALPTDIPEDFAITSSPLTVPTGATHLFIATPDSYYSDNTDPNQDYGVEILIVGVVPALPDWGLLLFGVLVMATGIWVMRRKPSVAH